MPLRNPFKRISLVQVPEPVPVPVDVGFRDADLVGAKPIDPEPAIEYQLSGKLPRARSASPAKTTAADYIATRNQR
jgi:hypothetical protein